jgi:hypothetical protein
MQIKMLHLLRITKIYKINHKIGITVTNTKVVLTNLFKLNKYNKLANLSKVIKTIINQKI